MSQDSMRAITRLVFEESDDQFRRLAGVLMVSVVDQSDYGRAAIG
jgi:hypothetical protein